MQTKKVFIISVLLFFLPVLQFLNNINLSQIVSLDLYIILFDQIILFIIIFFFSYLIYNFFLKKKNFNFEIFFLINCSLFYFLFYFRNIKNLVYNKQNFILDDIIILLIYFIIYFFLIKFRNELRNFIVRFLLIFIFLNILNFFYNFFVVRIDSVANNNFNKNSLTYFDTSSIPNKKENDVETIFFIIFDGMMSLDLAEKFQIIKDKNYQINLLKKNELKYQEEFSSNYDATYLSIASILKGSYPVTENSKKYSNREKFFPSLILNSSASNEFFEILRRTNKNFYWFGNWWATCQANIYIKCVDSRLANKFIHISKSFYFNSLYIYLFNFFYEINEIDGSLSFFKNKEKVYEKNTIYLVHVMNPHPTFFFDAKCQINKNLSQKDEFLNYSNAYNCLLKLLEEWMIYINKANPNSLIFVFGDHGWAFNKKIMQKFSIDKKYARFKPFFSYKIPEKCGNLDVPKSLVNLMRFVVNCTENTKFDYLIDLKFDSFSDGDKNFGKVILQN